MSSGQIKNCYTAARNEWNKKSAAEKAFKLLKQWQLLVLKITLFTCVIIIQYLVD